MKTKILSILIILTMVVSFAACKNDNHNAINSSNNDISNTEITNYIGKADELLAEKKYDEAIAELETAEQLYGANDSITAKKREIKKAKGLNDLVTLEADEKYKEGIEYIDNNLSDFKTDSEILGKRNLYVSKYKTQVIANADATLKSDGYKKAVSIINEGLKILPNDKDLTNKYEEYMKYAPVPLSDFTVVTGDVDQESEVKSDLLGNSYAPPNLFSVNHGWGSNGASVVYLRDMYSKLTGTVAKGRSDAFGRTTHTITIYGSKDGEWNNAEAIFYTKMKDTTEPVEFEIDLKDYKYLHIEVSDGGFFYLSNFEFWK